MNLDSKEIYAEVKYNLFDMKIVDLKDLISKLFNDIYIDNNPEQKEYHRLAAWVYQQRLKISC
jgi:hypothetical protein